MRQRTAILVLSGAFLAGCASSSASVTVTSEATGSSYFSLGAPRAYKSPSGMTLVGRVCRLARTTGLSPARVRLEHISAAGEVADVGYAAVPGIARATDQRCRTYAHAVNWRLQEGETVRACFYRGRACPPPAVKTVIDAPAATSTTP